MCYNAHVGVNFSDASLLYVYGHRSTSACIGHVVSDAEVLAGSTPCAAGQMTLDLGLTPEQRVVCSTSYLKTAVSEGARGRGEAWGEGRGGRGAGGEGGRGARAGEGAGWRGRGRIRKRKRVTS